MDSVNAQIVPVGPAIPPVLAVPCGESVGHNVDEIGAYADADGQQGIGSHPSSSITSVPSRFSVISITRRDLAEVAAKAQPARQSRPGNWHVRLWTILIPQRKAASGRGQSWKELMSQ